MERRTESYIRENQMIERGSRVIAAVSGGADSVCMFRLLVSLREILEFEILAVHVHHGLRGREADRDAEYVRELSAKWEVPCLVVRTDAAAYARQHGMSVEEAGRELRYQIFRREAERGGAGRIAVAHHQEDQAETILHNLFRGSGIKGLRGMEPVRGMIIRPLLWASRREILGYLEERGISYCTDSTNASLDYTRNKLRSEVIPLICREINPGAVGHIVTAGQRLLEAERYFDQEAKRLWRENRVPGQTGSRQGIRSQEDQPELRVFRSREDQPEPRVSWVREDQPEQRVPRSQEDQPEQRVPRSREERPEQCMPRPQVGIAADTLGGFPDILKGYVVMEMLGELAGSRKDITSVHISGILDLAKKGTGRMFSLPYGLRARREYGMIWLERAENLDDRAVLTGLSADRAFRGELTPSRVSADKAFRGELASGRVSADKAFRGELASGRASAEKAFRGGTAPDRASADKPAPATLPPDSEDTWEDLFSCPLFHVKCFSSDILREKHQKIPENKYTKWFDYDKIKGTLSVRTRRPGDYFALKDGKKKTIKAFMIDEKIPRQERDRILLVTEGQHVLWIVGRRISEFYKVTDDTKQILQVSMDGGKEHGR